MMYETGLNSMIKFITFHLLSLHSFHICFFSKIRKKIRKTVSPDWYKVKFSFAEKESTTSLTYMLESEWNAMAILPFFSIYNAH